MFVKKRKRNGGGGGGEGLMSGIIFSLAQMDGLISGGLKTGGALT